MWNMNDDYIYGYISKTSEDLVRLVELEIRRKKNENNPMWSLLKFISGDLLPLDLVM